MYCMYCCRMYWVVQNLGIPEAAALLPLRSDQPES